MTRLLQTILLSGFLLLGAGCFHGSDDNAATGQTAVSPVDWTALRDPDPRVREEACSRLEDARPEIVSALVEMLRDPNARVRREAGTRLLNMRYPSKVRALAAALRSNDPALRYGAAHALGRIGLSASEYGDAVPTIPDLTVALTDPIERVRVAAAWALSQLKEEEPRALQVLATGLESKEEPVKVMALDGLSEYGSFQREFLVKRRPVTLVASLLRILQAGSADFRAHAASSLGECGDGSGSVIAGLSSALADPDKDTRIAAAFSLSELPHIEVPEGVIPILSDHLNDKDGGMERRMTCWALERLNRFPPCVVETLTKHLADENREDRFEVACLLSRHAENSKAAVESVLVELLHDRDHPLESEDRIKAIEALGRTGLVSAAARKIVKNIAMNSTPPLRAAAIKILGSDKEGASNYP
jgi:HEAT repeat protein